MNWWGQRSNQTKGRRRRRRRRSILLILSDSFQLKIHSKCRLHEKWALASKKHARLHCSDPSITGVYGYTLSWLRRNRYTLAASATWVTAGVWKARTKIAMGVSRSNHLRLRVVTLILMLLKVKVSLQQATKAQRGSSMYSCTWSRLHYHNQTHTTLSRNLLDEWSARHRCLYLTTHNISQQTGNPCLRRDSNPQSQQTSGCKTRPTPSIH